MNKGAIYGILGVAIAIGIGVAVYASMSPSTPDVDQSPILDEPGTSDITTVDVGVLLPATGDLASHGNENKLSLDLAVVDFNNYLEENNADWRMNLVVEDTQSDPILALEKIQSLNSKGIKYALGPESSAETRNIMSYADSNDMIILSPSSTSPALAVADNIFRFVPDDTKQGKVVAAMLAENGIKVVVPIYRGDVWGDGLFASTSESFTELGGIVAEGIRFNPEITTFSTEADTLAKSVDELHETYAKGEVGIFVIGFDEVIHLFNSATEHEVLNNVRWFGSDGNAGASTITDDRRSADFATQTGFIATQFAASDNEVFEHVRDTFEESTGRTPSNNYVYSSYDSLWVLGLSMDAVGFDALDVKDQLAITGLEYTGALGTVRLNDAGDLAIADYELWGVVDGQWEPMSRYDAATGEIRPYDDAAVQGDMHMGITTVDVGVLLPATGDLASHGNENKISLDLAVIDFNNYLEENNADWRMNLVVEDTQSDPILALEKIQSLNSKGIKYALGPESSAETRNIMSYADSNDMIILSPSSTSPALAVADNIFRFVPDDTKQGKVVATMLEENGIKVVVPIYRGDVWGDGLFASTSESFTELGGIVAEGIRFNPEITTFSTEADILAKSVDKLHETYAKGEVGIFVIGFDEVIHLFNSATEYDTLKSVSWFGSDGNAGASTITDDRRSADFATQTGFIATQFAASDNEVFEHVRDTFEESTGRTPSNNYVYSSYDSLWVLGLSMDAVGFDALDVKDQLAITGLEYTGALGTVRLNDAGDLAIADYELWGVVDGQWEPMSRYDAATGEIRPYDDAAVQGDMHMDITTVDVGVLLPATGDLASHGNENKISLDLAVIDFNNYLEENNADWRMNLVVEDTQSDPILALEKIQSLNSKGIKYALGPESSAETRNIMSYADSNDMIILSPSSTSPALAVADNIFRFVPDDTKQGKVVATMLEENGIKVVVPIYRGDVWGDGLFASTSESFTELGGIVAEGIRFNPEITTFSTEADILAKSVDKLHETYAKGEVGIFVIGFDEVIHLFNSATEYDTLKSVSWFGSDGNAGASTITDDRRSADFATQTGFIATQFAASDNEVFEHVRDTFEESTGRTPSNNYVYSSYDSLWVLGLSMDAVGFDALDVKDQLAITGLEYTGALGTVRLNDAGDLAIADYELWGVVDGQWEPMSRYDAATGEIRPYDDAAVQGDMHMDITTVDVGVLLPATGDLASHGNENKISLDLAVIDFNNYLEENNADWRMNLVVEDTQSDPILALEKIQSLNSKGIKYALGPESSAETRNIMSYADSNDMIILSPSSTSPALAVADNIFRFVPDDTKQGKVVATMLEENGIKVVVPIYRGDVWGDGLFASTSESFTELGGIVAEGIRFNPEITTFSTEADILAKSVDKLHETYAKGEVGIFVIGFDEVIHLFNSATEYDTLKSVSWFGSDGNAGASTITDDRRSADFATQTGFIATQFAASDNEVFEHVRDTFEESTGRTPSNNYVYSSYDSLWVLGLSMDAVGFDALDVKDQLAITGLEYTGALGTVRLNDAGDLAIADYELWGVVDGQWEPMSRYDAATGKIAPYE